MGEVYTAYTKAFNSYSDTVDYIDANMDKVERAAHNDRRRTIISVLGWIISIVLAIASLAH
jgi:hypothetical protein